MPRYFLAALAVLLALLALPFSAGRSPSAPLPPADEELAKCPPLSDAEHLLPERFLRDWEEQQEAYLKILKPKVEELEQARRAGRRIDEDRLDAYRELLDDTNRRILYRRLVQNARDRTLSVRERRRALKALRDQFPEGYPGGQHDAHAVSLMTQPLDTYAIRDELRAEWDAAYLAICPPLSDADKLPSKETLDEWEKRQRCYEWVIQDKIAQLESDYVAGKPFDRNVYLHWSELRGKAEGFGGGMISAMQTARNPEEPVRWRRSSLRGLRVNHPAEYMAWQWPAPPTPPVPPELQEAYRKALADYPASVNRPHGPRR